MLKSRTIFIIVVSFFITSCAGDGWDSVKRGITGAKKTSVDEFLVQKKDPLVLPPIMKICLHQMNKKLPRNKFHL